MNLVHEENSEMAFRSDSVSPGLPSSGVHQSGDDPYMSLLFSGWNPDLPDPATLRH
jgi:hypothetical protein